jgi:hypothetical protein
MQILSIEKLGNTIFGCLDDGIHYQVFSVDSGCPVELEEKYPKSDYNNYDGFALFYCGVDPGFLFLEEPFHIEASRLEDLCYETLLDTWNEIWKADSE